MSLFSRQTIPTISQCKVPGKLYLAGEYAILEPRQKALLLTINHYLEASSQRSDQGEWQLIQADPSIPSLCFSKLEDLTSADCYWQYVKTALFLCQSLCQELGIAFHPLQIHFNSDLRTKEGVKLGLGSSGAVTIACLKTCLNQQGLRIHHSMTLYKLAVIVMILLKSKGSFGDLAANCQGGLLSYQAPDTTFLKAKVKQWQTGQIRLVDLLSQDWPLLEIQSLPWPDDLSLLIGWTQSPASTENLVGQLKARSQLNPDPWITFLKQAQVTVNHLITAFKNQANEPILTHINNYRQALVSLSQAYHIPIETPALESLITISHEYGYAAKSSGAGGGDCGIALGIEAQASQQILARWQAAGIHPLNFQLAPKLDI